MKIAFYAPMKAPDHPIPSGDQAISKSLISLLEICGHEVDIACRLRTWQREPDQLRQERLSALSGRAAENLLRRYRKSPDTRPDLWFTYHLYHKAPDWLGPLVSRELGIPYVVAEASFAPKQAGGPWQVGHKGAQDAIGMASLILGLNSLDAECVAPLVSPPNRMLQLRPFLAQDPMPGRAGRDQARWALSSRYGLDPDLPWLLTVAMMRDDAKWQSYQVLGDALRHVEGVPWQHIIAGDGVSRSKVEELFMHDRTVFTGQLEAEGLSVLYSAADIYVWPAINEAYGMALLDAQFSGLPVIAGETGGVGDIVRNGETGILVPVGDAHAFADALRDLLQVQQRRDQMGRSAESVAQSEHTLKAAAELVGPALREFVS